MKSKRYIYILLLFILCLSISGCKKIVVYNETDTDKYIDAYYEYLSDQKQGFVAIDFRMLETEYAEGHLKGFVSYQFYKTRNADESDAAYEQRMSENFVKWMVNNYSKSLTVFLLDDNGITVQKEIIKLKNIGYKKIYGYTGNFDLLKEHASGIIEIVKGTDDCGC